MLLQCTVFPYIDADTSTGRGNPMEYQDYVNRLEAHSPDLAREVASFHTLENVLEWMKRRGISLATIDVVNQDEYRHDVIIPLNEAGRHLVFGCT